MDWNGLLPAGPGDSFVDVIPPNIDIDLRIFDELCNTIDPLTLCKDHGVELCQLCIFSTM